MSSGLRTYIDTNVFVYMLIPDPAYSGEYLRKSKKFFQDITLGLYEGIISTYTETEYKGVVKKVISEINKCHITPKEENLALTDFRNLIATAGIGITDSDSLLKNSIKMDIFQAADLIVDSSGPIHHANHWKNIGGSDAIIVDLAIRSGASRLATFDRGFKGLNSSLIKPIIVQECY